MNKQTSLLITMVLFLNTQLVFSQNIQEVYQNTLKAKEEQNHEAFLKHAEQLKSMRPANPIVLKLTVEAYLLNGKSTESLRLIKQQILGNKSAVNFQDSLMVSTLSDAQIKALQSFADGLLDESTSSKIDQIVSINELHAEGLVKVGKDWYVSDIRRGRIIKQKEGGDPIDWFKLEGKPYTSVTGLKFDKKSKSLWVAVTNFQEAYNYQEENNGKSALYHLNLKGEVIHMFESDSNQLWGDLCIDQDGDVFVTNSILPEVHRYSNETGEFGRFLEVEGALSLQGISESENGAFLYLSDYAKGILRISKSDKSVKWLSLDDELVLGGVDGILVDGNDIYLAHNGTNPKRIAKATINNDQLSNYQLIDCGIYESGEPTHLFKSGNKIYYVSNSPWPLFEEGKPLLDQWKPLEIRVFDVE